MLEKYKMMNRMSLINKITICLFVGGILTSCTKDPNSPGYEFMPDMYRSASIEAYVDYNHLDEQSARLPVAHTIPFSEDASKAWVNFPYPFPEGNDGYAMSSSLKNPIPYSDEVIEKGGDIHFKFCSHCHGEKGDGQGQIALNGKIAGIPAFKDRANITDGQMFHSISYGKGIMGPHAPLLSKEERWILVHWIRKNIDENYTGVTTVIADSTTVEESPVENE